MMPYLRENKDLSFYWNPEFEGTENKTYKDNDKGIYSQFAHSLYFPPCGVSIDNYD